MIARLIHSLDPGMDAMLRQVASREACDAAPGDAQDQIDLQSRYFEAWRERWHGLRGWFFRVKHEPSQAELLRARARSAIPQLLAAIAAINERRSAEVTAPPISVCLQAGLPLAPTMPKHTGWRGPLSP